MSQCEVESTRMLNAHLHHCAIRSDALSMYIVVLCAGSIKDLFVMLQAFWNALHG